LAQCRHHWTRAHSTRKHRRPSLRSLSSRSSRARSSPNTEPTAATDSDLAAAAAAVGLEPLARFCELLPLWLGQGPA